MPVSKHKHHKKTNSFGIRKEERRKKELEQWRAERQRNRDYEVPSVYELAAPILAMKTMMNRIKKVDKGTEDNAK